MIDDIKNYLNEFPENQRLNLLREYLQNIILKIISDLGYKNNITFTGGTALRIIYKINRFSEDLDFSLTQKKGYIFNEFLDKLKASLEKYSLEFEFNKIKNKTVNSFFIRFIDLLYPLNLTNQKDQKFSIKIDIDTNPPADADITEYIYYERFYYIINHFTLESLFALKLHALLFRKYIKGRDYYDLVFFLNKKVLPKFKLFKNAVKQTNPESKFVNLNEVFIKLKKRIDNLNYESVVNDIRPFLLKFEEIELLKKKNIILFFNQYMPWVPGL